jgi:hypothetical protein
MLPTIEKTEDHLNIAQVAAMMDVPPTELGFWRKLGVLPAPVAYQRRFASGRPRLLWDKATIVAFKAERAKLTAEAV